MKNLLLVVLLLPAATKAVAQWNQGSPFYTTTQVTNGNVGIGHTSPQSRLLVRTTIAHQGLVIANCDTNGNQSHFALTTADQARAGLATESYFNIYNSGKWMFNSGNTSGGTTLPISFATDGASRLYIKPDGNIGIGTATPWSPLTIEPGQLTLSNNIGTNYTEVAALNFANRAISGASGTSNNARISVQTAGNHFSSIMSFHVRSGNAAYEAMRIMPDGSVGIGTTSPSVWFGAKTFEFSDTRPVFKMTSTSSTGLTTMIFTNSGVDGGTHYGEFHLNYEFNQANTSKSLLRFGGYPGGNSLVLVADGSVGVGTTTTGSFKLAVEGKIGAREVNVLATGWPDYVFEKNYNLPTLTELEAYIKVNKHLPEVPSACVVEENGVNLGEMNAILLKKVEELTLYVIELKKQQDKQNEIHQHEIDSMKKQIGSSSLKRNKI